MKKIKYLFIILGFLFLSCNNDDSSSQDTETQNLDKMDDEIISASMVNSTPCTDPTEWSFTAIGEKGCGGPAGYIAYSLKINVPEFLKKVENYTNAQKAYNKKWGVISDCSVMSQPNGVDCVNGKPKLIYSNMMIP